MFFDQISRSNPVTDGNDRGGNDIAIRVQNISKCYHLYGTPRDRLKQFVLPRLRRMMGKAQKQYFREFWSLKDISFEVKKGEVLGIIGKNGAGKSTLLQILCGTLTPTVGAVEINGRVAALLELGAGFNPEFTGRENVYLNASVLGLSAEEIDTRFDEIVAFSDIGFFIDQPVKTYSSGMFIRLAFSIATSVDPDILVIDEALSVGDSAFARKSFDRIMALREAGKTILFCSHSMHQIEAICNRAVWLNQGRIALFDEPARVVTAYNAELMCEESKNNNTIPEADSVSSLMHAPSAAGVARIDRIEVTADGRLGRRLAVQSGETDVVIRIEFSSDHNFPPPAVAIGIVTKSGHVVTSAGSIYDGVILRREPDGHGFGEIVYPHIPLFKGDYTVSVFLTCERLIHIYDYAERCAELVVEQRGLEQGVAALPHVWRNALLIQE